MIFILFKSRGFLIYFLRTLSFLRDQVELLTFRIYLIIFCCGVTYHVPLSTIFLSWELGSKAWLNLLVVKHFGKNITLRSTQSQTIHYWQVTPDLSNVKLCFLICNLSGDDIFQDLLMILAWINYYIVGLENGDFLILSFLLHLLAGILP